jgi:hypothetical protein
MRSAAITPCNAISIFCGLGIAVLIVVLASCGGGSVGQSRQLIAVSVQPTPANAVQGGSVTFIATGTFDHSPTTKTNLPVRWASWGSNVVTIDPNSGTATCVVVGGPINITASAAGKSGTVAGCGQVENGRRECRRVNPIDPYTKLVNNKPRIHCALAEEMLVCARKSVARSGVPWIVSWRLSSGTAQLSTAVLTIPRFGAKL